MRISVFSVLLFVIIASSKMSNATTPSSSSSANDKENPTPLLPSQNDDLKRQGDGSTTVTADDGKTTFNVPEGFSLGRPQGKLVVCFSGYNNRNGSKTQ